MMPDAFDHWYVKFVPVFAESTTEPPVQNEVAGAVMVAVGNVFTVITVAAEVAVQPLASVTATVYESAVVAV